MKWAKRKLPIDGRFEKCLYSFEGRYFWQRKLFLTVSIIFLLFPRPPIVIVLELALRRRGAGATGGIGGGKRDIVVEAAAASASLHCGKYKSISSPFGKLDVG